MLQARQTIEIEIASGACLEYLPQETIIFEGATYRQDLENEGEVGVTTLISYDSR